jgi:hypothetical protein
MGDAGASADEGRNRLTAMAGATTTGIRERLRELLREGLPFAPVAFLALGCVLALLLAANTRTNAKPLAYAELSVRPGQCLIDPVRSYNVTACFAAGPRTMVLTAVPSLKHTTPVVSEGSCCVAVAGASVTGDREVTVAFRRLRGVVRATVVLP